MRRQSTGKRLEITPRDLEVFKALERYRYLNTNFLHAFVGGASATRFKERLGDLFHEGQYLDRPVQQWELANARHRPAIYQTTPKARQMLGLAADSAPRFGSGRQFAHAVMACHLLASIELATRSIPGLRFVSWLEILTKAPDTTQEALHPFRLPVGESHVVPDGMFGLVYEKGERPSYRFFALEADRETMPVIRSRPGQSSYLAKMLAYRTFLARDGHKTYLGIPNLLILTVTTSHVHQANIQAAFEKAAGGSAAFLFKTVGELLEPSPSFILDPWPRVGHPPLSIVNPH